MRGVAGAGEIWQFVPTVCDKAVPPNTAATPLPQLPALLVTTLPPLQTKELQKQSADTPRCEWTSWFRRPRRIRNEIHVVQPRRAGDLPVRFITMFPANAYICPMYVRSGGVRQIHKGPRVPTRQFPAVHHGIFRFCVIVGVNP